LEFCIIECIFVLEFPNPKTLIANLVYWI